MHVLVTGGAGFIGSHLVNALLARGDKVLVVDDFSSGLGRNLPISDRLRVIEFQLGTSAPQVDQPDSFDAVVHLAGQPSVSASWIKAIEAHERNLTATLSMIDLCRRFKIPRFVFASSAAVYGLPVTLPIREDAPCSPLSPYGIQKLASENYLGLFAKEEGLCSIALRFFNVYGPGQRPDSPYSGVISIFVEALRKGEALKIYGDGTQTRDFVFVGDVVRAICASLDISMIAGDSLTMNIGTGVRSSLLDLVEALQFSFPGARPEIRYKERRLGDIPHSQPDISQAITTLRVLPECSLKDGLRILVDSMSR